MGAPPIIRGVAHQHGPPLEPPIYGAIFDPPLISDPPPSYPPLGLAAGADELAHAVALGLKPSGLRCRRPIRDEPALCEDRDFRSAAGAFSRATD